ncbi:MAG TPA: formate dehydrogenase accessory sulfurtransferase FdhD [Desulfotomaculum sp.]|nr:MAG: formate dehydrogenase [Peptococcaceae bacterium BRH_c8a]KJS70406.1 MAG: formate dehydrogenase [Desulfotomaculum sp. BICA1-6]KJS78609.1 MAG: formate dehydrogenase [Desulfotomaculum sp. BICA1-6]HBX22082.1 formate dehydrogenase accessory sulfurtransferase FdhD [Desulfotomaculum sp.]
MPKAMSVSEMKGMAADIVCDRFSDAGWVRTTTHVPSEMELILHVNRQELVSILCTPTKLNALVLGFLYAEGIITGIGDVVMMRMCEEEAVADVWLSNSAYQLPTQRRITSGCGGGTVFKTKSRQVASDFVITPTEVLSLMKQLQGQMELYRLSGGVHTSALSDTKNLLVVAEDIGRHNTIDKIQGECLLRGLPTKDRLLLSTGRVSSEMLLKAAKMQAPVVVSLHSPTGSAVALARDLGIALVGHARGSRLTVYSHPERLGCPTN